MTEKKDETKSAAVDPFEPVVATISAVAADPQGVNLKVLVFDMGHVFVDFEWQEVREGFCRASGRTHDQLKADFEHVAGLGYEKGDIDTAGFLAALNERLGTTITVDEFKKLWNATFRENAEMAELLAVLKEQRPLYLLSNTNEVHFDFLEGNFNVTRHFQEVILSYKVGSSKPSRAIYEEVLTRSGLRADECLFVDDLTANVKAASEKVGMHVIQFTGVADLKERLVKFGLRVERGTEK